MFRMWLAASTISKKICKSTWEMCWWKSDNQQLPMSWQFWFLKSVETRSLTLNLFTLSLITNQYIRDITAKVKTEMVKMYLTPLGRFLSSVLCGSWKNDRKMSPLRLCRGCEGQGLMDNRPFAASHSHSPSVPCDSCSPALQRAYSLSTLHLSVTDGDFISDDTRGDTAITYSNHHWAIVESIEGQSVVSTGQVIMYVIGDKNLGGILGPP